MRATRSRIALFALILLPLALLAEPAPNAPPAAPEVQPAARPFGFPDVEQAAKLLATKPYVRDDAGFPEALRKLGYEQYRDIRYKADKALWKDEALPFQLQAFHRGFIFTDRVVINVVDHCTATRLAYSPELFDYGKNQFPDPLPADLGFAGLRFHYPLRKAETLDEIAVFLGASYFRAAGLGQVYGLSARALAIDTGLTKAEEFPIFREFWIEKPAKDAVSLTVYALLDSPSLSGAHKLVLRPGLDMIIDVSSHLFFRKPVERLGIAPLTSMFFHGENTDRFVDDLRPEAHDSDGLLIGRSTGEWIWRPLNNPRQLRISVFGDTRPSGFGLMTRDRDFDHYQDLEARFERRPNAWVEALGDWGKGATYLIEIPSDADKYDNIVAFWVPEAPTGEGKELQFDYRLHFSLEEFTAPGGGKVVATRIGPAEGNKRRFVVDFASPTLRLLSPKAKVEAEIGAMGKVYNTTVRKNDENGTWRLSFDLEPQKEADPIELRAILKSGPDVLTESWVYQWNVR